MSSKEVNGTLIVQPGAYMASFGDVRIGYSCDCNIIRCCCGGMVRYILLEKKNAIVISLMFCFVLAVAQKIVAVTVLVHDGIEYGCMPFIIQLI